LHHADHFEPNAGTLRLSNYFGVELVEAGGGVVLGVDGASAGSSDGNVSPPDPPTSRWWALPRSIGTTGCCS
jgi:hypothetical protein